MHDLTVPTPRRQNLSFDLRKRNGEYRLQQVVDDPAKRLLRRPSIQLLGAPIPKFEDAVHIANENGVVGEIQKVGFRARGRFGAQDRFGLLVGGHSIGHACISISLGRVKWMLRSPASGGVPDRSRLFCDPRWSAQPMTGRIIPPGPASVVRFVCRRSSSAPRSLPRRHGRAASGHRCTRRLPVPRRNRLILFVQAAGRP